ncbi:DUF447 domain-containing protein [Salarchaeum sp. JOR-1]|uniref:DUF447 domain-containing protein n=1 Tax=Salarchaeum sp. JOR-1 TaxID=2599399 RepID=UPI0011989EDD|nr:DUF447 domain-containing protein [Salarchaeum sp. JOR-1]QDX41707.1 DUF447 family protein [Salarchaeum sp. JOR-1]
MTEWPVSLRGVTETVVTTRGPNEMWNAAALGVHAPRSDEDGASDGRASAESPATATTWGRTRTRGNFERRGEGYVQFTTDPVLFVEAALSIHETDAPVLDAADAWARVTVERLASGESGGTEWVEWALRPVETDVLRESVAATNRGYYAVVEATVAASRLDVPAYEEAALRERLDYFADVVARCGGEREREAMALVAEYSAYENESF